MSTLAEESSRRSDDREQESTARPRTPLRAYIPNSPLTHSPASTLNDLVPICESPTNIKQEPFPDGTGVLAELQPTFESVVRPAGLSRKPIECTFPSMAPRYDQEIVIDSKDQPWELDAFESFSFLNDHSVPGWKPLVQPDGQPYFLNNSQHLRFRYLTETNLYEDRLLDEINFFVSEFEERARRRKFPPISSEVEVVLQPTENLWLYYMVDVERRCVFWMDKCVFDGSIIPPYFGIERKEHLRHLLDFEFWQHMEFFPHNPIKVSVLDEVIGILAHGHIDVSTSQTSHSAYTADQLQALIGSLKQLKALHARNEADAYVVTSSARIMSIYAYERFFNFYGFHGARLSVDQSVRKSEPKSRLWLFTILSFFLFNAPDTHLARLEKLWTDETIKGRLWTIFKSKLEDDWQSFVLYATVLLPANMAFLAIPFVESNNNSFWMSPAAVLSQVSTIASLGSIIVGLLLTRQLRMTAKESADDALMYLRSRRRPQHGLETMAIQYSLPYALLMWGMVAFLVAIMTMCFYNVEGWANLTTRLTYGCTWLFVCLLILWTAITGWETKHHRAVFPRLRNFLRFVRAKVTGKDAPQVLEEQATEFDESVRNTRMTTVAQNPSRKAWRERLQKMAEKPRRFTSRGMTLVSGFSRRTRSLNTPRSPQPSHTIEGRLRQPS